MLIVTTRRLSFGKQIHERDITLEVSDETGLRLIRRGVAVDPETAAARAEAAAAKASQAKAPSVDGGAAEGEAVAALAPKGRRPKTAGAPVEQSVEPEA